MGSHSSRATLKDRSFDSSSTPSYSLSLCTTKRSSVANKKARTGEFDEVLGHSAAATKRELAEREQSSNYYSNDYRRLLSQRKAALRYEKEQRQYQLQSNRSQASGFSPHLSKEDLSYQAESQSELFPSNASPVLYTARSRASSVISEASVRTVAHKPLIRQDGGAEVVSAVHRHPRAENGPPRRLRWFNKVDTTREVEQQRTAATDSFFPLFAVDTSPTTPPHHSEGCGDGDWGWGGNGGCDTGGGGFDTSCPC